MNDFIILLSKQMAKMADKIVVSLEMKQNVNTIARLNGLSEKQTKEFKFGIADILLGQYERVASDLNVKRLLDRVQLCYSYVMSLNPIGGAA